MVESESLIIFFCLTHFREGGEKEVSKNGRCIIVQPRGLAFAYKKIGRLPTGNYSIYATFFFQSYLKKTKESPS